MTESHDGPSQPPPAGPPAPDVSAPVHGSSSPAPAGPPFPTTGPGGGHPGAAPPPSAGSHWRPSSPSAATTPPPPPPPPDRPATPLPSAAAVGVPPRPNPLPPPRSVRPGPTESSYGASTARPAATSRPVTRPRRARLVLKRVDPWSVFLYSVVSSIFLGVALVVASVLLYAVLSKLGVLSSLNKLIGDVTAEPGTTAAPSHYFSFGKVLTFSVLLAAVNVVLLTALATLSAFLYNLCAALTGGIEVTLSDQD